MFHFGFVMWIFIIMMNIRKEVSEPSLVVAVIFVKIWIQFSILG